MCIIDLGSFHVEWRKLTSPDSPAAAPGAREMHCTCGYDSRAMVISGGISRDRPEGYGDVWCLHGATAAAAAGGGGSDLPPLQWVEWRQAALPMGSLFGHSGCISQGTGTAGSEVLLTLMSGVSNGGACIVEDTIVLNITKEIRTLFPSELDEPTSSSGREGAREWEVVQWRGTPNPPFGFRMGLSCLGGGAPRWLHSQYVQQAQTTEETGPPDATSVPEGAAPVSPSLPPCVVVFGGIDQNQAYRDCWLLLPCPGEGVGATALGDNRSGLISVLH